MYNSFKISIIDHIASVSFNRPEKANSLHKEAWIEMQRVFEDMDANPEVRVVVLSGEGKHFCAGIDLALLIDGNANDSIECEGRKRELVRKSITDFQNNISAIEKCRKPVIAAVHNGCIGAGLDIATACDIRYCTKDTFFVLKEVDMGLVADIGTMQRLPKIVNPAIAAEMAYTGRKVSGSEAREIGLVNNTFSGKEEMMEHVMQIAKTIAEKSPMVIRGTKHILQYTRDHSVQESLDYMATFNAAFMIGDDLSESFKAHVEKRTPVYKN